MGGLAIAIGLVIDDAIVIVENIHRHLMAGETPVAAADHGTNELVGVFNRQLSEHDRLGDREHAGHRAHAEGERQHRGDGEDRRPPQPAEGVADILTQDRDVFTRCGRDQVSDDVEPQPEELAAVG